MSGLHAYGGDCPGMSGRQHYGSGALGTRGDQIASSGASGPSPIYNCLALPADAAKEYYIVLTSVPVGLTVDMAEPSDFAATAANDGKYVAPFDLYEFGALLGSSHFDNTFGVGTFLVGSSCNGAATSTSGTVTVTPPSPGVINLAGSSCVQIAISGTGAISKGSLMSFTPSVARTVSVQATSQAFTAGSFWNMADPKKPRGLKDPDATLDFTFDWAPWLLDATDAIAAIEFIVDGGLAKQGETFTDGKCTVFLSAGTLAVGSTITRAPVTCRITTTSTPPRIEDRTIYLDIEAR